MSELEPDFPADYTAALASLKDLVREAQNRAQRVVNTAMIELYWNIGRTIPAKQADEPWGSKVLDRPARDLRAEFPHMKGFPEQMCTPCAPSPRHGPARNQLSRHRLDN